MIVAAVVVRRAFIRLLPIPLDKPSRHLQNNIARQFFESSLQSYRRHPGDHEMRAQSQESGVLRGKIPDLLERRRSDRVVRLIIDLLQDPINDLVAEELVA